MSNTIAVNANDIIQIIDNDALEPDGNGATSVWLSIDGGESFDLGRISPEPAVRWSPEQIDEVHGIADQPTGLRLTVNRGPVVPEHITLVTEPVTPERPLIDFSDANRDRSKVRAYAELLISNVNKDETNVLLRQVADGGKVDAYALNAVLPDALSGCVTRWDVVGAPRHKGTKAVRAIAYIVNATLTNHADGLPVLEPGSRSPRIAELEGEVSNLQAQVERREADYALRLRDIERHREAYDRVVNAANQQATDHREVTNRLENVIQAQATRLDDIQGHTDGLRAVLGYAISHLDPALLDRIAGFGDAHGIEVVQ